LSKQFPLRGLLCMMLAQPDTFGIYYVDIITLDRYNQFIKGVFSNTFYALKREIST